MHLFDRKSREQDSQDIAEEYTSFDPQDSVHPHSNNQRTSYTHEGNQYPHYIPGQPLATIRTGETLRIDHDESTYQADNYAQSTSTFLDSQYQYHGGADNFAIPEQYYAASTAPHSPASHGFTASADGAPTYVDHFNHDTEAYASGIHSRSSYYPPRSRSPTPAVDDEDYHIVGNTSIHYTGTDGQSHGVPSNYTGDETYYTGTESQHSEKEDDEQNDEGDYLQPGAYAHNYYNPFASEKSTAYDSFPSMQRRDSHATSSSGSYTEPHTPHETRHFGPAPIGRITRRHKEKKRVPLTRGNLVIDIPIPSKLVLPRRGEREMKFTRYTAATCDPDEFDKRGFYLRQIENGRRTEMFIVITLYNEDEIMFCRTLYAVMQNITHLTTRKNSQTWGPDAWKKVVVCIVADGRRKVHPRVLDCLALLGVYQEGGFMKSGINMQEVQAHIFEYTTTFGLDSDLKFRFPDKGVVPTQIIFA